MKRKLAIYLAATMLLSFTVACANNTSKNTNARGESIQIAVAGPMTGDNSEYGLGFYNAAKQKAKEWNTGRNYTI